jgi:hypothetical protein
VIQTLNKKLEGIFKVTTQLPDGSPIEPKGILSKWCNDCGVLARKKCKITWIDWGIVPVNEKEALWELIKAHYVLPSEHEECGKRATILTIARTLLRFRYALNKFYVQPGVSRSIGLGSSHQTNVTPFNNCIPLQKLWRNNRMKELIQKNKFKHRLGPGGYKVAITLWTNKKQEIREAGVPDPLEGCTLCTRNWIWGRSRIDDNRQLVTSNSNISRVIENAKDLVAKEKIDKFKPRRQKDQLSAALTTEEH